MGSSIKENDTMDRRIRKTRAALKGALANLMLVKQVKDISVRELTDLADVNRGTFYLHYKDVFDLLEKTEDDILEEFKETLNEFDEKSVSDDATRFFESVYTLCMKNGDFIRILIGENGDIRFLNSLKELLLCLHRRRTDQSAAVLVLEQHEGDPTRARHHHRRHAERRTLDEIKIKYESWIRNHSGSGKPGGGGTA